MNIEEAIRYLNTDTSIEGFGDFPDTAKHTIEYFIRSIYDNFESRTCENCKFYSNRMCMNHEVNSMANLVLEMDDNINVDKTFGCNRFEEMNIIKEMISDDKVIKIGSYGLGLDDCNDYDFAIHESQLEDYPELQNALHISDIRNYVSVMPLSNSFLYKIDGADVLVYGNQKDLDAISKTMSNMRTLVMLDNDFKIRCSLKDYRIEIFKHMYIANRRYITGNEEGVFE